jgi:hypothetical protein
MRRNPGRSYLSAVLLIPLLLLAVTASDWIPGYRLERGGRETMAQVRGVASPDHGGTLNVVYTAGGRTWTRVVAVPYGRPVSGFNPGDPIAITYLASNPAVVQAGPRPKRTMEEVAGMLAAVGLLAAVFLFFPLYFLPRRRNAAG